MTTPWVLVPGIVFDTRSVLLGISGLFFGTVPTIIAMVILSAFRYYLSGSGTFTGILVILATGSLGIAWRHFRTKPWEKFSWNETYLFGFVSHLVMLALMLTLPWETALKVLSTISLPVLLIYPLGTVMLGVLLTNRLRREQIKNELAKATARLNAAQRIGKTGGWEYDMAQQNMIWTDEVYRIFGIQPGDLLSVSDGQVQECLQCYDPTDYSVLQAAFQNCLDRGQPFELEFPITSLQGELKWIQTRAEAVYEQGKVIRVSGNTMDITERKQAVESLRANEEKFRAVFDSANVGKSLTAPTGEVYINKAFAEMLGYSQEELAHRTWQSLTPPEDIDETQTRLTPLLEGTQDSARFNKRYIHKNGSYIWGDVSVVMRRDRDGKPLHFITTVVDITEQRQSEQENKRLSRIFENSLDEIFLFDANTLKFRQVNAAAISNLGYSFLELQNMTPLDIKPDFTLDRFTSLVAPLRTGKKQEIVFETLHQRKNGTTYPVEVHLQLLDIDGDKLFAAIILDITGRKRSEDQVRQKMDELIRFQNLTVGRELKMIELKKEINALLKQMGKEEKYEIAGNKEFRT